ncbi:hypothetical protein ACFWYW_58045 [Nonomuraea sp. NPDC059023]|uniref:hypothetical protein n=1 Tax=unclassified Nonomuraea TaxID=2593643 RepID=UPI00369EB033
MIIVHVSPALGVVVFGTVPRDLLPLLTRPQRRGGLDLTPSRLVCHQGELGGWCLDGSAGQPSAATLPRAHQIAAALRHASLEVEMDLTRHTRPAGHAEAELYARSRARGRAHPPHPAERREGAGMTDDSGRHVHEFGPTVYAVTLDVFDAHGHAQHHLAEREGDDLHELLEAPTI